MGSNKFKMSSYPFALKPVVKVDLDVFTESALIY